MSSVASASGPGYPTVAIAIYRYLESLIAARAISAHQRPCHVGLWRRGLVAALGSSGAEFKACVALQAQYVFDTFGRFPGTVPTVFILNYVQAHHLDLDFYDRFFKPGAYLRTHAEHMQRWHDQMKEG
jgi:hypothetical protein